MNKHIINLHSDLSESDHEMAITNIRETLWAINPRNILRTVVEEVAATTDGTAKKNDFPYNQEMPVEHNNLTIEIVDGLDVEASYALDYSHNKFLLFVRSVTLAIGENSYTLESKFDFELGEHGTYDEFVHFHSEFVDKNPSSDSHVDILLDNLFDFTDIDNVWVA